MLSGLSRGGVAALSRRKTVTGGQPLPSCRGTSMSLLFRFAALSQCGPVLRFLQAGRCAAFSSFFTREHLAPPRFLGLWQSPHPTSTHEKALRANGGFWLSGLLFVFLAQIVARIFSGLGRRAARACRRFCRALVFVVVLGHEGPSLVVSCCATCVVCPMSPRKKENTLTREKRARVFGSVFI